MTTAVSEANIEEDPKCAECQLAIEEGSVVAFGDHIWHVSCFRCAKCGTLVDHDSNLLLLSNGKPICENCSYNCRVCERKIDDLAIMTGDESYHSECFRCRLCYKKIEDLVFAKTSQGIYCIACHNDRMSKNRKQKSGSRAAHNIASELKDKNLPSVPTVRTKALSRSRAESDLAIGLESPAADVASPTEEQMGISYVTSSADDKLPKSPTRSPPEIPSVGSSQLTEVADSSTVAINALNLALLAEAKNQQLDGAAGQQNTVLTSNHEVPQTSSAIPLEIPRRTSAGNNEECNNHTEAIKGTSHDADTPSSSFGTKEPLLFADHATMYPTSPTNGAMALPIVPPRSVERSNHQTKPFSNNVLESTHVTRNHGEHEPKTILATGAESSEGRYVDIERPTPDAIDLSRDETLTQSGSNDPAPTTPRISHKRDFSANVTPANAKHTASRSLETSPNLAYLGASVTTFEGDLSSAFNLSPRGSITPVNSLNTTQLERSNTISRLANRMLKHRKSVSGSALSPKGSPRTGSIVVEHPEVIALQQELKIRSDKIIQLETALRQAGDAKTLKKQLEHRKSHLANLQSQIAQSQAETSSYLHHRHRISDVTVPFTEWKANVVADVEASLRNVKDELSAEIENLMKVRNDLRMDVEKAQTQKASLTQEVEVLQQRHDGLLTINNNMLKKIQAGMVANKDNRDREQSISQFRPDLPAKFSARSPSRNTVNTQISETESGPLSDSIGETETLDGYTGYAIGHDIEEEEHNQPAQLPRTSGDSQDNTPKKFNFTKKAKKAFRWGRPMQEQNPNLSVGIASESILSGPTMSSSKSNDRITTKIGQPGLFKRTWQSQNNLAGHANELPLEPSVNMQGTKLFGTELCLQASYEGRDVPSIVSGCIAVIEATALDFEGLYRKSGGAGEMKNLTDAFEASNLHGTTLDFSNFRDISAITSVLKQYLRRLPTPLIVFSAYESFISTSAFPDAEVRLRAIRDIFRTLPRPHYETLKVLFTHLALVSSHCDKNLMTAKNLAVVLGPTVIWDQTGSKEITDMLDKNLSIQFLIENAHQL